MFSFCYFLHNRKLRGKFLSKDFGIQINNGEPCERGDKRRNYRHWDWISSCLILQWWRHNFKVSTSSSMQILLVLRDKIKWKCQTEILRHTLHYLFESPFNFLVDFIENFVLIFCGWCHCEGCTLRIFCPFMGAGTQFLITKFLSNTVPK